MALYRIKHETIYRYQYPVAVSHHSARLTPISNEVQTRKSFRLAIDPDTADLHTRQDYFGNEMHLFSIQETHDTLHVVAESEVDIQAEPVKDLNAIDATCGAVKDILADLENSHLIDAKQFLYPTAITPIIGEAKDFGMRFLSDDIPIGPALLSMLDAFRAEFEFDPKATEISTPITEVLSNRRGVCQDFAHVMIASLRSCGLSARYASGYILTHPTEGEDRLTGADASHAWVSVFVPEHGWIDLDPTNRLVCGNEHACVAYGRDYADVSMLKGAVTGGGEHSIEVMVSMEPISGESTEFQF